ncbi:MAG: glucose-6-phosphate isomerase [Gammaproteobacteria bacterium]|nr:MAG: glucose-6-phosphate isomerase [Gammaproteobacteria bacterium]
MPDAIDQTGAWRALERHRSDLAGFSLRKTLREDSGRFPRLSCHSERLLLDFSRNLLTDRTLELLRNLAATAGLERQREAMFAGEPVNVSEHRPALHCALRAAPEDDFRVGGEPVTATVLHELERFTAFAEAVRRGEARGTGGEPFASVISIGIGGSHLGPALVLEALAARADGPPVRFLANLDGHDLNRALAGLDPARTLVLVMSKSFGTLETRVNAEDVRTWLVNSLGEEAVASHFAAVTSNPGAAGEFGIPPERQFTFQDWVGGRYSLWSAIGLPAAIGLGREAFLELLAGAREMDRHFRTRPLLENLPVLLALIGVWYINFHHRDSLAVVPYDERLRLLPAWLQQLEMESNGKGVHLDGSPVSHETAPVVWGGVGSNAQHAFFQRLHQGPGFVPLDLLAGLEDESGHPRHHRLLLANCLAQAQALAHGRDATEVRAMLEEEGLGPERIETLLPHRSFPGNRPSNLLLYRRLDPRTLGQLLALYEHKVFCQAAIWQINPFDQWGVELGKQLAGEFALKLERDDKSDPGGLIGVLRRGRWD